MWIQQRKRLLPARVGKGSQKRLFWRSCIYMCIYWKAEIRTFKNTNLITENICTHFFKMQKFQSFEKALLLLNMEIHFLNMPYLLVSSLPFIFSHIFSVKMDKQNIVNAYNRISFSFKKEGNYDTRYNMDETWGQHIKWNQPVTRSHKILYDSTHMRH